MVNIPLSFKMLAPNIKESTHPLKFLVFILLNTMSFKMCECVYVET